MLLERSQLAATGQMIDCLYPILILTTIEPYYKQLKAFRANWLPLMW